MWGKWELKEQVNEGKKLRRRKNVVDFIRKFMRNCHSAKESCSGVTRNMSKERCLNNRVSNE